MADKSLQRSEISINACRFSADVAIDAKAEVKTGQAVPITIKARSAGSAFHWWWGGNVVHDMAGMTAPERITLDYCHDDRDVVGYGDKLSPTPDGLVVGGALTPFTDTDRASEIILKSGLGVPYQASIYFDPCTAVVEDVPAGQTAEANGQTFAGPVSIVRQWEIRGVAICPYGVDSDTSVAFASRNDQKVTISRFTKGATMSAATNSGKFAEGQQTEEEKKKAEEAAAAEAEKTGDGDAPKDEGSEGSEDTTGATEEAKKKTEADAKMSADPRSLAKQMIGAFGAVKGAEYFAEGLSFEQAQTKHIEHLANENKRLAEENGKLSKRPRIFGEERPAAFNASQGDGSKGGNSKPFFSMQGGRISAPAMNRK